MSSCTSSTTTSSGYAPFTQKLDLEPISREMNQKVDPNRPTTLRNHVKMDWTDQQNKGQPKSSKFSEEELIELMGKCIDKKLIVAISGTLA